MIFTFSVFRFTKPGKETHHMAVNVRKLFPLEQAKARRIELMRYLRLDGGRYLIAAALMLSLMSLLSLGQTGRLATRGYQLAQLQIRQTELLRERSALLLQLSEAESLTTVEKRAKMLNLRPMAPEQARYITIAPENQDIYSKPALAADEHQASTTP
jgi:hypothetical protein